MLRGWLVVGAGRCGLQLARAMAGAGLAIAGVVARSGEARARARRAFPASKVFAHDDLFLSATSLLIAVPDDELASCAEWLAWQLSKAPGVALHTSGVLAGAELAPLAARGTHVGSMHPLRSFPSATGTLVPLGGVFAAVEGDDTAARTASRLARSLGMEPHRLSAEAKPVYHAAAALAANFTHILVSAALEHLKLAGLGERHARKALEPLVHGAVAAALVAHGLENLTGPVRRGDTRTVSAHLSVLSVDLSGAYRSLARYALDRLVAEGLVDTAARRRVMASLTEAT